jgi:hypothetical protein
MKIRLGSPILTILLSIGGFIILFGAVLDTFSNAVNLITANLTYILTAVVLISIPIIQILEKRNVLNISNKDGSTFSILDWHSLAVISALLIVLWMPRAFGTTSPDNNGLTTQRGFLHIPTSRTYEVFYPKAFSSTPNLTFSMKVDNVYTATDYDIVEQRPDGFKIKIDGVSGARVIEWIAVGIINENGSTK